MKKLNFMLGTLLIFGVITWISFNDGMSYDGETSVGFPLKFYTQGVGQNLDSKQMAQFSRHSYLGLAVDVACSFLIYLIFRYLFIRFKRWNGLKN